MFVLFVIGGAAACSETPSAGAPVAAELSRTVAAIAEDVDAAGAAELWDIDRVTTGGRVVIAASPAAVYARATDYAHWRDVFSDVTRVELLEGGADDGLVRFESRALARSVTVRFANTADVLLAFTMVEGPPGAVGTGRYLLIANEDGTSTMTAELYMELTGVPGLFVSDKRIRKMRRNKLRADLDDLAASFDP